MKQILDAFLLSTTENIDALKLASAAAEFEIRYLRNRFRRIPFYLVCTSERKSFRKSCFISYEMLEHEVFMINFISGHESSENEPVELVFRCGKSEHSTQTLLELNIEGFPQSLPSHTVAMVRVEWNENALPIRAWYEHSEEG